MKKDKYFMVPLPDKMKHLSHDPRGYPIPFVVLIDKNGRPHFTINDHVKITACINDRLCTICGNRLHDDMWLIGGPLSAFSEHGAYIDPPVHKNCGYHALQVCPFLSALKYKSRIDDAALNPQIFEGITVKNNTMMPYRPAFFVFVKVSDYHLLTQDAESYIVPVKPFLDIEYWEHGIRITAAEAQTLIDTNYK